MKLAVSNIAWPAELDAAAFALLLSNGIRAIEIAPTRVWPHWREIGQGSIREFRATLESAGLCVSSLQSILFQRPELRLFGSNHDRRLLYEHLCLCADLAADLGAYCLVFGAPKNRDKGELTDESAFAIATEFFSRVGEYCAERKVCVGFEANPKEYGCNFATNAETAAGLVRAVGSEGFRLHLDVACMYLSGEDPRQTIHRHMDITSHLHVSEPYLGTFAAPSGPHSLTAGTLKDTRYDRWIALEMRASDPPLHALEEAIGYFRRVYGGPN